MPHRLPELNAFLDAFHAAILARAEPGSPADAAADRIFSALAEPAAATAGRPKRLPICRHLAPALATAAAGPAPAARLAAAFAALEPHLTWETRANAAEVGEPFQSGHGNVFIVGPGRLESRQDVWVGVSLMAPGITYVDHHHAPEEVYAALSPGGWRQGAGPWHEPGLGGLIYNPPNIVHAMQSGDAPLLAAWCLWAG
mgnify:CR=1 FL=1